MGDLRPINIKCISNLIISKFVDRDIGILLELSSNMASTSNPMHDEEVRESFNVSRTTSTTSSSSNKSTKQPSNAYLASKGISRSSVKTSNSDSREDAFKMKLHLEKLGQHGLVKRRYLIATFVLAVFSILGYILGGIMLSQGEDAKAIFAIATLALVFSFVTAYHFAGHYYNW